MEATYVQIDESHVGKIVAQDIYANTQYPIVYKNTEITEELLHVFKVFQISKVLILIDSKNIKKIGNEEIQNETIEIPETTTPFEKKYQEAVSQFKKEFINWQSGAKIEIVKVRSIILPLVEDILLDRTKIFDLNNYSDPKDYLYHHCIATGLISSVLAQKLGYDKGFILQIGIAGLLADCGMAKIPVRIREKKQALNHHEYMEVQKHPILSYQMVKELPALKEEMKEAIFEHHERLDGSGYPKGLKINDISIFSQIIAVADTFHAMTSERIFRAKESPFKVVEMIKENEFGKFDIKVVSALINIVVDLPIGTKVEISNFERAEVMFVNKYSPTRPLVKLRKGGEILDLSKSSNLYIHRIITN